MCSPGREELPKSKQGGDRTLGTRLWILAQLGPGTGELVLSGPFLRREDTWGVSPRGHLAALRGLLGESGMVCLWSEPPVRR